MAPLFIVLVVLVIWLFLKDVAGTVLKVLLRAVANLYLFTQSVFRVRNGVLFDKLLAYLLFR